MAMRIDEHFSAIERLGEEESNRQGAKNAKILFPTHWRPWRLGALPDP